MVDGVAWLKQLESQPAVPVLLGHAEAIALARSLAAAQAMGTAGVSKPRRRASARR